MISYEARTKKDQTYLSKFIKVKKEKTEEEE